MKVLVTGGAGFIGSHIVERLLGEGEEVVVVDNFDPYYDIRLKEKNVEMFKNNPNYTFVKGNILDRELMHPVIKEVDAVIHMAAQADISKAMKMLGYNPKYNLDEGLKVFSEWMKIIYNDKKKKLKIGKKCQLTDAILFKLYHNEQKGKIGG